MTIVKITVAIEPGRIQVTGSAFALGPRVEQEDAIARKIADSLTASMKQFCAPDGEMMLHVQDFPKDEDGNTVESKPKRPRKRSRL